MIYIGPGVNMGVGMGMVLCASGLPHSLSLPIPSGLKQEELLVISSYSVTLVPKGC